MTVLQRELKEIRRKEEMAIVITDPVNVYDADMTELYPLENHLMVIKTPVTMMKAIMYFRRHQMLK